MLIHQMKELYSNYCVIFIVTPELSAVIIFTFVSDRQKCSKIISQYLRCLKSNFTVLFLLETRSEREGHTNYTLQVIKTLTTPLWSSEEEGSREIKLISKPKAHIWIDLYMFFVFLLFQLHVMFFPLPNCHVGKPEYSCLLLQTLEYVEW